MRYPIHGTVRIGSTVTVYNQGTSTPATIYAASVGGGALSGGIVTPDAIGGVVFYMDEDTYRFPSFFDIVEVLAGYATIYRYDVWHFFSTVSSAYAEGGGATPVPPGISKYTLADMRTRLAIFGGNLDESDAQVKAMLNECIQTGYEKVVSTVNMHSRERELAAISVLNQKEYSIDQLGIPTFVGYSGTRLIYLPYEVMREKYSNFDTTVDPALGDPVNYSLVGYDGEKKTLVIAPAPKESGRTIYVLCFQNPGVLSLDTDYPLVPQDWGWLVLERAKIERVRFKGEMESYEIQAREFVAYVKVMVKRLYPAAPEKESGFVLPPERIAYNAWRARRT